MTADAGSRSRIALGLVLAAAAPVATLTYQPTSVTGDLGALNLLHLAIVFALWSLAVVSWGWAAQRALTGWSLAGPRPLALAIALGTLGFAAFGFVLLAEGRPAFRIVSLLIVSSGLFLFALRPPGCGRVAGRALRVFAAALFVYAAVRFVQVTRLSRHGDPLCYHLVAPVMWTRSSSIAFDAGHPFNYQASLWEGIYLWPAEWFLGPDTAGLPELQIFAQWTHVALGWIGIGVAAAALLRALKFSRFVSLLGAFAALATYSTWWSGGLAKNDCGTALWVLAATLLLLTDGAAVQRPAGRLAAAGVLAGAAFMAKYTVAFALIPTLAAWGFAQVRTAGTRTALRRGAIVLGAAFLAAVPFLIRNVAGTGEAFFPIAVDARKGSLSETSREYLGALSPSGVDGGLRWRGERLGELARESALAPAFLLAPALLVWAWRRSGRLSPNRSTLLAATLGSVCLFLLLARPGTDLRLLGPGLVLASVAGALTTFFLARAVGRRLLPRRRAPVGLVVAGAIAATCRFAPEAVVDRWQELPLQRGIAAHTAGDAKLWAATHLDRAARIVTTGDNEVFYLLGSDVAAATDDVALDRLWREDLARGARAEAVLADLRARGYSILLDTRFPGEVAPLAALLRPAFDAHPEWIAFEGRDARLIDLRKVRE